MPQHRTHFLAGGNHFAGGRRGGRAEIYARNPETLRLSHSRSRNGVEALDVARKHSAPIHLLLTDIIMPGMGGMELTEKFKAEFPSVPVLFMSGYADQIIRHWDALSAYIQKPFTLTDLLTQVRELLDRTAPSSLGIEGTSAAG